MNTLIRSRPLLVKVGLGLAAVFILVVIVLMTRPSERSYMPTQREDTSIPDDVKATTTTVAPTPNP